VRTKQTKEKRTTDSLALVKAQQIKNKKISDSIAFVRTKQTKEKRTTDSLALIKAQQIKTKRTADSLALSEARIRTKKAADSITQIRDLEAKVKRNNDSLALVKNKQAANRKKADSLALVQTQIKKKRTTDSIALAKNKQRKNKQRTDSLILADKSETTTIIKNNKQYYSNPNANKIEEISGLFYTVQIGVFGKVRTSEQLLNITPLFYDLLNNGYYRYYSGIYKDKNNAVAAKNAIIDKGIKDAFVVVFYKGQRISSAELKTILSDSLNISYANKLPVVIDNLDLTDDNKIIYKVQIGAFKRETDLTIKIPYLATINETISYFKTETGLIIYTIGTFNNFSEVNELKNSIITNAIKDAFIIAFQGKNKIPVYKARELEKK
ncbi:MAG: hypothetical protein KA792_06235, partial [Bacteroidales bacterium]|nr:hypothetical protein [Bacteroidales bacterium]